MFKHGEHKFPPAKIKNKSLRLLLSFYRHGFPSGAPDGEVSSRRSSEASSLSDSSRVFRELGSSPVHRVLADAAQTTAPTGRFAESGVLESSF